MCKYEIKGTIHELQLAIALSANEGLVLARGEF
jgi:hypothetical protein